MLNYQWMRLSALRALPHALLGHLLPSVCPACGREPGRAFGRPFCVECFEALDPWGPACGRCGRRLPADGTCGPCLLDPPPQAAMAHALAYEGDAREALHLWKFSGIYSLTAPFAGKLVPLIHTLPEPFAAAPLVPVPPHPWRLFGKDYHPVSLLAEELARLTGRSVRPLLAKRTLHRPQSALDRTARLKNIRGTFAARGPVPPAVVLLDDVCTTGATLREALAVLRRAGARDTAAVTLARTP